MDTPFNLYVFREYSKESYIKITKYPPYHNYKNMKYSKHEHF